MLEALYEHLIGAVYQEPEQPEVFVRSKAGPKGGLSAGQQLAIYRDSVRGGLIAALGGIYPALRNALGEEFFEAMAARFIQQNPSRSVRLDDYGCELPDFISTFKPLADYPYMPDLALLEWHWHCCFHHANESAVPFEALAAVDLSQIDSMQLELIDALACIDSAYPLEKIWRVSRFPEHTDNVTAVDLSEGSSSVVVYREGLDTRVCTIDPVCRALIQACQKPGQTFGTICAQLESKAGQEQISQALLALVQNKWIAGLRVSQD